MNETVTIRYGLNSVNIAPEGRTLGELLSQARGTLQFGDNVKYFINGTAVGLDVHPEAGTEVKILTAANQKA